MNPLPVQFSFFFFNDTATTEIYTLSLHDALPICRSLICMQTPEACKSSWKPLITMRLLRSEEHTSELQSRLHLVCRLLLEKKKNTQKLTRVSCTDNSPSTIELRHLATLSLTRRSG